jgi:hypothetical protein
MKNLGDSVRKLITAMLCATLIVSCSRGDPASPIADSSAQGAGGAGAGRPLQIAQARGPLPAGVVRLQRGQIMDPNGFDRPMVAETALMPVGWRAQGGYVWGSLGPCATSDYNLNWTLMAPDGISAVAFVPKPKWQIVQSNLPFDRGKPGPCESGRWTSAKEYLEFLAQQASPQARILDYMPRQDLIKQQEDFLRTMPALSSDLVQVRQRADAGQLLLASTLNGREVREVIRVELLFQETHLANVMNPGQTGMVILDVIPLSVVFARAPAGELNVGLPDVIAKSLRRTAEWSNRVFQHNMKKQQDAFEAAIRAGEISYERLQQMKRDHQQQMAGMQETKQARDRLYDQSNLVSDKNQREFVEAIRGVETYHEPVDGGVVQLDNTYDHAWRVRDGTYLLTDDPNFRPGLVGLEGQELRRVQ